jgi:hypothetical protein
MKTVAGAKGTSHFCKISQHLKTPPTPPRLRGYRVHTNQINPRTLVQGYFKTCVYTVGQRGVSVGGGVYT